MTDLNIIRPRKDILLAGSGNPTVATTARVGDRYQNTDAPYEMFTCVSKQDFGWGDVHGWVGTQGTIVDPDILNPSNANLVAGYTMDSVTGATLNDMSANGNNGTITGATQVPGKIGNALSFDGTDEVDIPGSASLNPLGQLGSGYAGAIWFSTVSNSGTGMIMNKYGPAAANQQDLSPYNLAVLSDGTVRFGYRGTDGIFRTITSSSGYNDGTYHLALFNFDGATNVFTLYVDDVLVATSAAMTSNMNNTFKTTLGYNHNDTVTQAYYNGDLDHGRLYNRSLISAERTAVFNEGNVT